ncbi:hypothetical protein HDR70_02480 [bacterium]|nr:hypothetical protein [bacterium]
MNLRFSYPIEAVDPKAYRTVANVIIEFINYCYGVHSVEIGSNEIKFKMGVFSSTKVKLIDNNLTSRNGIIYCLNGNVKAPMIDYNKCTWIVNALKQLEPGYIAKLPF